MARVWYLDRTFDLNTKYELSDRLGMVIRQIGTNVSDEITLWIDNRPTIPFHGDMAPITFNDDNMLGMLDLGDYYFVIPPNVPFEFKSSSSGKVRVRGELWILEHNEDLPSEYYRRLDESFYKGISYKKNTVSLGTDVAFGVNDEVTLIEVEPSKLETYLFDDVVMIKAENINGGIDYGMIGILFYTDTEPKEKIVDENPKRGIDIMAFPYPPNQTNGWYPFTLKQTPIKLTEGYKLKITAINVSGADISPVSGTSITFTIFLKMKYEKVPFG